MQATKDAVVVIDYTLTDSATGQMIDSSKGKEPLPYIHGQGAIIPGLERALEGKKKGDRVQVTIAPVDGYGEKDPKMVSKMPRSAFGGAPQLAVGMKFEARGEQGSQVVTVTEISGDEVTIDGNHVLAGVTLNFDVTIKEIRKATGEELAHGHVHGPGGHHHH
jgi:FKBP-type peptidyl-prolyl cis-trans isomerase SlyD